MKTLYLLQSKMNNFFNVMLVLFNFVNETHGLKL
jgi:hypothetical protein